jgi:hypothetical protein
MSGVSIATAAAVVGAAAAVAGTVYTVTQSQNKGVPSPQQIQNPQAAPTLTDPAVQLAAQQQQFAGQQAAGRASTILTGGQGDTSTLTTNKKALLGG